jgi:hypothetical protein
VKRLPLTAEYLRTAEHGIEFIALGYTAFHLSAPFYHEETVSAA